MSVPVIIALVVGVVLLAVAVGAGILLLLQVWKKRKAAALAKKEQPDLAADLKVLFKTNRRLLEAKVPDRDKLQALPRYLVLGEPGAGKTTLLGGTGLSMPLGDRSDPGPGDGALCHLWLLGKALAYDVSGRLLFDAAGKEAPPEGFKALLHELRRDRPERPIDGIVLAMPCRDVLPESAPAGADQKRKAGILHKWIALVQHDLQMCVPVYTVVTQCDRIEGFRAFGEELPASMRQGIFGWSSPYVPGLDIASHWFDDAAGSVAGALRKRQTRRFGSGGPLYQPDAFFLFPTAMAGLGDGLKGALEPVFVPGPQEDPLTLRGIYFTGDGEGPAPPSGALATLPGEAGAPQPSRHRILFARELFERKIIPEASVGWPSSHAVRRRNRAIFGLHLAAVGLGLMLALVLFFKSRSLGQGVESTVPLLEKLVDHGAYLRAAPGLDDPDPRKLKEYKERAGIVFDGIGRIQTNGLRSVAIPGSWPSFVDDRIESAVALGYERIILEGFRRGLHAQLESLLAPSETLEPQDPAAAIATLDKSPEFIRTERWLRALLDLETDVARYDGLLPAVEQSPRGGSGRAGLDARVADISDLALHSQGIKLRPSVHDEYYRGAVAREMYAALQFPLETYAERAKKKAGELFGALHGRLVDIHRGPVIRRDLSELEQRLAELERGGADYNVEKLRALRDAIERVERDIATQSLSWIATKSLPPLPEIERLLELVKTLKLLGKDLGGSLEGAGASGLDDLKTTVAKASLPLFGAVLAAGEAGALQMKLSPALLELKALIDALLAQKFMSDEAQAILTPELGDARIAWDVELLRNAPKLPKEYEAFIIGQEGALNKLAAVAPGGRATLIDLAQRKLKDNTFGAVARAAGGVPAVPPGKDVLFETTRADVANLGQASVPLRELIAAFDHLSMADAAATLRKLLSGQGSRLLLSSGRVLDRAALYAVKGGNFNWWEGDGTPVFEAFGVLDAERLGQHVTDERSQADAISKELAEPVLGVLESPEVNAEPSAVPGMARWQQIAGPLRDHEGKKAGNSVSVLEGFLLSELPAVTLDNCLSELSKPTHTRPPKDFFSGRRKEVRDLLFDRCAALASTDLRTRYATLRRIFNRDLAGRFPFAKYEAGNRIEDASPEVVRQFLKTAHDFRGRYRGLLAAKRSAGTAEVVRFLDKLEDVYNFLMPMWAQAEAAADGFFETRVDFRVNQLREIGGNQIAEWVMRIGEERLTLGMPKPEATFRIGDPVRVELRWAKNSADVPSPEQGPTVTVSGRTVSFEEGGAWALLRMIAAHKTAEESKGKGEAGGGNVLSFVVYIVPDPEGGYVERIAGSGSVRVFIRVGLRGTEKDKQLEYPEFPIVAPSLTFGSE